MSRFVISPRAIEDIAEIKRYLIVEAGTQVTRNVLREFRAAFLFLAGTPGAGHTRDDLTKRSVEFWSVFSYLIVYNPAKQPIEIVRVLHGNRDVTRILDSEG